MFVFTFNKGSLRRVGALTVAGIALAGVVFATGSFFKSREGAILPTVAKGEAQTVDPATIKIENAESINAFFESYAITVDMGSATVDKVKIPKKWDESFSAFNTVVKQSGFDLVKYKGKTVEKWMVLSPDKSEGEQKVNAVLLVYKSQPVGAYLVAQPSGEVTGLVFGKQDPLPLTESEKAASAEFGEGAEVPVAVTGEDFTLEGVGEVPVE